MDIIRVEIDIPGQGKESHEYGYCLLYKNGCRLGVEECKYGLTQFAVPKTCLMKVGVVNMRWCVLNVPGS